MEKLLHERLREFSEDYVGKCQFDLCGFKLSMNPEDAMKLADEIERYYAPYPQDENGEPLPFGTEIEWADCCTRKMTGFGITSNGKPYACCFGDGLGVNDVMWDYGEHLKHPTPKVYDADGVEIKVGDTVYSVYNGNPMKVEQIRQNDKQLCGKDSVCCGGGIFFPATEFTHEKPVFDADNVRICKGDTVWVKDSGLNAWTVTRVRESYISACNDGDTWDETFSPESLTHKEPDSYEKLRDYVKEQEEQESGSAHGVYHEIVDRLTALIERGA